LAETFSPILDLIWAAIYWLYGFTGDWGWAIILLTVFIRLALTPLVMKQTKSMYEMQRIQPKIKELQKKYKDDKTKLQEETLKFYQENKVNPFGGCLPMLLQMPIFISLFYVLRNLNEYMEELPSALQVDAPSWWIIIPDLTAAPKDIWDAGLPFPGMFPELIPYVTLVVLFGLSVWLPQQLMPGEGQQKQVALVMAAMMLYFGWISPAGVLLYWVTSSVIGLIQQQLQIRYYSRHEEAEA
jgi:YidC/Oxa1 family membrane protein insertase